MKKFTIKTNAGLSFTTDYRVDDIVYRFSEGAIIRDRILEVVVTIKHEDKSDVKFVLEKGYGFYRECDFYKSQKVIAKILFEKILNSIK